MGRQAEEKSEKKIGVGGKLMDWKLKRGQKVHGLWRNQSNRCQTTYTATDHILVWIRAYLCVLFFLFPPGCARFKDNNKSFKAVCFLSLKANVKFLLPEIDGGFCFFLIKWHKFNCKPSQLTLITLWKIWYMWCVRALFSFIKCSGHSPAWVSVHANAVSTVHCFKPGVQWST